MPRYDATIVHNCYNIKQLTSISSIEVSLLGSITTSLTLSGMASTGNAVSRLAASGVGSLSGMGYGQESTLHSSSPSPSYPAVHSHPYLPTV